MFTFEYIRAGKGAINYPMPLPERIIHGIPVADDRIGHFRYSAGYAYQTKAGNLVSCVCRDTSRERLVARMIEVAKLWNGANI